MGSLAEKMCMQFGSTWHAGLVATPGQHFRGGLWNHTTRRESNRTTGISINMLSTAVKRGCVASRQRASFAFASARAGSMFELYDMGLNIAPYPLYYSLIADVLVMTD
jgi:hypothetical protein